MDLIEDFLEWLSWSQRERIMHESKTAAEAFRGIYGQQSYGIARNIQEFQHWTILNFNLNLNLFRK